MPVSRKTHYPSRQKLEANLVIRCCATAVGGHATTRPHGDTGMPQPLDQLVPLVEAELSRLAQWTFAANGPVTCALETMLMTAGA